MKFLHSRLLIGISVLVLTSPVEAITIGITSSEIDWSASDITINSFNASHPDHEANFSCFGAAYPDLPIQRNLDQLLFDEADPGPIEDIGQIAAQSCFQQAGVYNVTIELFDNAGNSSTDTFDYTVYPNVAVANQTTVEPQSVTRYIRGSLGGPAQTVNVTSCLDETILANGLDECRFNLVLRDRFRNRVSTASQAEINVLGRTFGLRVFDLYDDPGADFTQGIRFVGETRTNGITINTNNATRDYSFGIKSWVPTLNPIVSGLDDSLQLPRVESRQLPLTLTVRNINPDGSFGAATTNLNKVVDLQYDPWVKAAFTDIDPDLSGADYFPPERSEPTQFPDGTIRAFYIVSGTLEDHYLPNNFTVKTRGYTPISVDLINEDLDDIPGAGHNVVYAGISSDRAKAGFSTNLVTDGTAVNDQGLIFGSRIIQEFTEAGVRKSVYYPGGNLGTDVGADQAFPGVTVDGPNPPGGTSVPFIALVLGADIEGNILSEQQIQTFGSSKLLNVGGVTALDAREDITRQAVQITRGITPTTGNPSYSDINDVFVGANTDVVYFKGGLVTIDGGTFSGVKTIVIEDGNLLISDSLSYASNTDSLGIIMLNSAVVDTPDNGNIFVGSGVRQLVGTYYADGGLISTDRLNPTRDAPIANPGQRELTNNENPNAPFGNQLLLEGTLFTRNTLGGAFIDGDFKTPWQENASRDEAVKYDLHFIRRYTPPLEDTDGDGYGDTVVADNANSHCFKANGTTCDRNYHAFVVRTDNRVGTNPPPGFTTTSRLQLGQ